MTKLDSASSMPPLHVAILVLGVLAFTAVAAPDQPRAPMPVAGVWTLVAADRVGSDGVRKPDYGAHPHGRMVVEQDGRYATQIYSDERPRFAGGDKAHATPDELAKSVLGMSAHFGTISIDVAAATLTFHIERSAFPNWEATEQRRHYELHGDELTYQVPASASTDGSIAISVWKRAPH